jgi:hypothetical protein
MRVKYACGIAISFTLCCILVCNANLGYPPPPFHMLMILAFVSAPRGLHWVKFYQFHCMYFEQHMFGNSGGTLQRYQYREYSLPLPHNLPRGEQISVGN